MVCIMFADVRHFFRFILFGMSHMESKTHMQTLTSPTHVRSSTPSLNGFALLPFIALGHWDFCVRIVSLFTYFYFILTKSQKYSKFLAPAYSMVAANLFMLWWMVTGIWNIQIYSAGCSASAAGRRAIKSANIKTCFKWFGDCLCASFVSIIVDRVRLSVREREEGGERVCVRERKKCKWHCRRRSLRKSFKLKWRYLCLAYFVSLSPLCHKKSFRANLFRCIFPTRWISFFSSSLSFSPYVLSLIYEHAIHNAISYPRYHCMV